MEMLEINGKVKSISAWARFYGRNRQTVFSRIRKGWNPIDALSIPGGVYRARIEVDGVSRTQQSWAKKAGITVNNIRKRRANGWSGDQEIVQPRLNSMPGITAWGRTQTLREWSKETGISTGAIMYRIRKANLPPELALSLPLAKGGRKKKESN